MRSQRRFEGYLLIDHAQSPGTLAVPEGRRFEAPTITCCHCNTVVILNPLRTRARHYCASCDHYTCDRISCVLECKPFARVLDDLERTIRRAEAAARA